MALNELMHKLLGEQRTKAIVQSRPYGWLVDGVANNVFSQVYILNEMFIAGLTFQQSLQVRVAAAIGNMITGRPYGIWRDKIFELTNTSEKKSHWLRKYAVDVAAFATGQSPIYAGYLAAPVIAAEIYHGMADKDINRILNAHAMVDWERVKTGVTFLTFAAPALGRPQGWTYNWTRRQFGIEEKVNKESNALSTSDPTPDPLTYEDHI